jgi:hypothetical protein
MHGLHEVLPGNVLCNPFRALLNKVDGVALIQPPFSGSGVLEEVSGDVGITIKLHASSEFGTVVHFYPNDDARFFEDIDRNVDYTFKRLLDALGATVKSELFVEYYGNN